MRQKGFTLIELMVAISIAAILSVAGLASFSASIVKSRDSQRKSDLSQIAKALEAYNTDFGSYPDSNSGGRIVACNIGDSTGIVPCDWGRENQFRVLLRSSPVIYLNSMPEDPVKAQNYVYVKDSTDTYALYAAIENAQDRDIRKNENGVVVAAGWEETDRVDCGTLQCNYKLTESGLITR